MNRVFIVVLLLFVVVFIIGGGFAYTQRKGTECTPPKKDPNAETYQRDAMFGKCVVKKCKTAYALVDGRCKEVIVEETAAPTQEAAAPTQEAAVPVGMGLTQMAPAECDSVANGTVMGNMIDGCEVTCNTNYRLVNGKCEPKPCESMTNATVTGNKVVGCTTVCNTNYILKDGMMCVPAQCDTVQNGRVTGNKVSGCDITCNTNYRLVNGKCEPKPCKPVANASVTGNMVSGCNTSCNPKYELINGKCEKAKCVIPNGKAMGGNQVDGCEMITCDTNYMLRSGSCVPEPCGSVQNGRVTGANKVSGCSITCNTNYRLKNGKCDPIPCDPVENGIVVGNKAIGCTTRCNTNYMLRNGKCVPEPCDPVPNGTNVGLKPTGCTLTCNPCYSKRSNTCVKNAAVDCDVTDWGPWSGCDAANPTKLVRKRTIVTNPSCGGTSCPTNLVEEKPCTYARSDSKQPYGSLYKSTADGGDPCEIVCDNDSECVAFTRDKGSGQCDYYKQDDIFQNERGTWLVTNFNMDTFFKTENGNRVLDTSKLEVKKTVFDLGANIERTIGGDMNARMCITDYLKDQGCTKGVDTTKENASCKTAVDKVFGVIDKWSDGGIKVPTIGGDYVNAYGGAITDDIRYAANVIPALRRDIPGCEIIKERPAACYFTEKSPTMDCNDRSKYFNLFLKFVNPDLTQTSREDPKDKLNKEFVNSTLTSRVMSQAGCCK